ILLDMNNRPAAIAELANLTSDQLADVVVDATGSHQSMGDALEFAAIRGRVVYVGISQQNVSFPHAPIMHRRELTLLASRNALSRDFTRIIELIEQGRIDTVPWITHHAGFAEMIDIFPQWLDPASRVIKAIVNVD
ncbi:MAG: zinc-binding dehydrogenase, partial [Aureliella sp.]